ncbi:MAG: type VII toxin-antitoxin system HepT family RNase toxin [Methylococcales bacterium]
MIEQKLESLHRCLRRVADKCPSDPGTLAGDPDLQDIVALNLCRAVQLCVDIGAHLIAGMDVPPPDTMGQTFDALAKAGVIHENLAMQLKKAVGFRNIAVHNYEEIEWAIVHTIARHHPGDFTEFAKAIASRLAR